VALKDDKTLAEPAEKFDVHTSQITQWKTQLLEAATEVFLTPSDKRESVGPSVKDMQAKIGELALENDFWPARWVASTVRAQRNDRTGP
jgi:transposase